MRIRRLFICLTHTKTAFYLFNTQYDVRYINFIIHILVDLALYSFEKIVSVSKLSDSTKLADCV